MCTTTFHKHPFEHGRGLDILGTWTNLGSLGHCKQTFESSRTLLAKRRVVKADESIKRAALNFLLQSFKQLINQ